MSNYGVFSGLYFLVFGLNAGKYGPEKTIYLEDFHVVIKSSVILFLKLNINNVIYKSVHPITLPMISQQSTDTRN